MKQKNDFDGQNHQIKSDFHTIKVEKMEKSYRDFFDSFDGTKLELDICKEFDFVDYQSLLIGEQFLKK